MTAESSKSCHDVLDLAVERGLIMADQAETLRNQAAETGASASDLAIKQNLLTAADLDLLAPLAQPCEYLPGYEFLQLLGTGAAAAVYLARQTSLDRRVALKLLRGAGVENQSATARSELEAQLSARLRHPNIVAIYDYGVFQGRIYLAMELIEGETLLERIIREGQIDESTALYIVRQVAHGLAHAQEENIVHRDIKPSNLLLSRPLAGMNLPPHVPAVKVADFGLAFRSQGVEETRLTAAGATIGTPCYVAPEQLEDAAVDSRADIYALGASLFHMVGGKYPFYDSTPLQAIVVKLKGDETWLDALPDDVSPEMSQLIRRMTAHDPNDRIGSYGELIRQIDALLEGHVPTSTTFDVATTKEATAGTRKVAARPHVARKSLWRNRWRWLAAVGLCTIVAAALFLFSDSGPHAPAELNLQPNGWSRFMFDGFSVPIGGRSVGQWEPTYGAESARVLAGTEGSLELKLPQPESGPQQFYKLHFGVHPLEGAVTEIHIPSASSAQRQTDHLVIRLADGIASLGTREGQVGEYERLASCTPSKLPDAEGGASFHKVDAIRQPDGWIVRVNGQRLGAITLSQPDIDRVVLVVRDGTAHFESLQIDGLELADDASAP